MTNLTPKERHAIKVMNFVATFDGIIRNEEEVRYIIRKGVNEYIDTKRQHLVSVSKNTYPIRVIIHKQKADRNEISSNI